MTTISLHNYLIQIDELIEERRFSEAVAHCRHILQHFPRHIDTYRTLAKVLLEQGEYQDAADLFQRILSADPNDFIAHAGLSVAYQEDENLRPKSILHLERALDQKPYNPALQDELGQMLERDGKIVPDRFAPTSAALARLYMESEMYQAAINELYQALDQDRDRMDLKVLLAKSLWRANHRVEVVALCLEILDVLPNCIQANAILAETWLQTGRIEEAQTYLKNLHDLTQIDQAHCDEEEVVCHAFLTPGAPPIPEEVTLEYMGEMPQVVDEDPSADWVTEFSLDRPLESGGEDIFEWLGEDSAADAIESSVEPSPVEPVTPTPQFESTDWFVDPEKELADEAISEFLGETSEAGELAEWLQEIDTADPFASRERDVVEDSGFSDLLSGLESDGGDAIPEMDTDETDHVSFTDLFRDQESAVEPIGERDLEESEIDPSRTPKADVSSFEDDDFHTGFTDLFDELSADPFQEDDFADEMVSDTRAKPSSDSKDFSTGEIPDWLTETSDNDFEPIQIDNRLTSDWLTDPDEEAEKVPDESEEDLFVGMDVADLALADLQDSEETDDAAMPTWMLDQEGASAQFETPLPLEDIDSFSLEDDDLAEGAEIPDWLLGDDQPKEATGALEDIESFEAVEAIDSAKVESLEDDLASLVGDDLPDWLIEDGSEALIEFENDRVIEEEKLPAAFINDELSSEVEFEDDLILEDDMEESVIHDHDEQEVPQEQPEEVTNGAAEEMEKEMDQLSQPVEQDESLSEAGLLSEDEESASLASRIAAGEGSSIDELPTQVDLQELAAEGEIDAEDLGWLTELGEAAIEPTEEPVTLDWDQGDQEVEDVLAGVTGELKADLDWLDTLAEESDDSPKDMGDAIRKPLARLDDDVRIDTGELGWLDELEEITADTGSLEGKLDEEIDPELALPELGDALVDLADEPDEDFDSIFDLGKGGDVGLEEGLAVPGLDDARQEADAEPTLFFESDIDLEQPELAIEEPETAVPDDLEDAMAWLEGLAANQGAPLEELPSIAQEDQDELVPGELLDADADPDIGMEVEPEIEPEAEPDWLEAITDIDEEIDEEIDESVTDETGLLEFMVPGTDLAADEFVSEPAIDLKSGAEPEPEIESGPEVELEPELEGVHEVDEGLESEEEVGVETFIDDTGWLKHLTGSLVSEEDTASETPDFIDEPEIIVESEIELAVASEQEPEYDSTAMIDDVPEDLDDAMGWLEELAAKQGAPLEELPSIAQVVDEAPAVELEELAEVEAEEELLVESAIEKVVEPPSDELADALDWLETLAREEGADFDDVEVSAVSASEGELAEALDWLEQLAVAEEVLEAPASPPEEDELIDLADEMPDDPDEALAWIQHLSEDQGDEMVERHVAAVQETVLADMPEIDFEESAESDIDEQVLAPDMEFDADTISDIPDDPDAAMAWLEQLAAKQGALLEELPTVTAIDEPIEDQIEVESDLDSAAGLAAALAEAAPDIVESESWLDELVEAPEETLVEMPDLSDELDLEVEPEAIIVADEPVAGDIDEVDFEVPDDMDDAMSWLEELAAQQGTDLEELPTLAEKTADIVEEAEVVDELPVEEEIELEAIEEEIEVDDEDTGELVDTDALIETEPVPSLDGTDSESIVQEEELVEDSSEDSLPEWLSLDEEEDEIPGRTDWLDSLVEPDITGWLEAEEDVTSSTIRDRRASARPEPQLDASMDTDRLPPLADVGIETGPLEFSDEEVTSVLDLDENRLTEARRAVSGGEYDGALSAYQELVDAGGGMMTIIADLEAAAEEHVQQPHLRHLLGDAYMRNGQLQKALDTYRLALDQL